MLTTVKRTVVLALLASAIAASLTATLAPSARSNVNEVGAAPVSVTWQQAVDPTDDWPW